MNEPIPTPRLYYRVKEASRIMGVPVRTLYHLAETGQVPSRRLGTVVLLPADFVYPDSGTDGAA